MGEAVFMYPELLQIVDTLMPEDVRLEDDGTNHPYPPVDDSATPSGATRRAQAKRRGVDLYNSRRDQAKARKLSRTREAEDIAERCTEQALSSVPAKLGAPSTNMNSEWRSMTDEVECVSARLSLRLEQTRAYEKFSAELDKQAETDPEGNGFMSRFLKRQIKNLEDTMLRPENGGDGGAVGGGPGAGAGEGSGAGDHKWR